MLRDQEASEATVIPHDRPLPVLTGRRKLLAPAGLYP